MKKKLILKRKPLKKLELKKIKPLKRRRGDRHV